MLVGKGEPAMRFGKSAVSVCLVIVLLFSLILMNSKCHAGGYLPSAPSVNSVLKSAAPVSPKADTLLPEPQAADILDDTSSTVVIEKRYVPEKETPLRGSAIGFYGNIPTVLIGQSFMPIELEVGGRVENLTGISNAVGLLRVTHTPLRICQDYLGLHYGASLTIDNQARLPISLFIGSEVYLLKYISLNLDISLLSFSGSGNWRLGDSVIGARMYL